MDVHYSVIDAAEAIRTTCAIAPVVAVASETGRRRGVAAASCAMAENILQSGRSVAVVDCDFEAPMLHEFWNRDVSSGLSSVLAGERMIEEVFDYRALRTARFLTVDAGAESARRAHLFRAPAAERAVRRLVDFAEIVLLNVGPLSAPHAQDVVAICDSSVVVVAPDRYVHPDDRPGVLRYLRTPIAAWIRDLNSGGNDNGGHRVPAAAPAAESVVDFVPSWIENDGDSADAETGDLWQVVAADVADDHGPEVPGTRFAKASGPVATSGKTPRKRLRRRSRYLH